MKSKMRYFMVIGCMCVFALMSMGCSVKTKPVANQGQSSVSSQPSTPGSTSSFTPASSQQSVSNQTPSSTAEVLEEVIYDDNGVKITAKEFTKDNSIVLEVENNSGKTYSIMPHESSVNGIMIHAFMEDAMEIPDGSVRNCELEFMTQEMKENQIDEIATVRTRLTITDFKTPDGIIDTDLLTIHTTISDSYVQQNLSHGQIVLDENGIKIIVYDAVPPGKFSMPQLKVYVENSTESTAMVEVHNVVVSGFDVTGIVADSMSPNTQMYTSIHFCANEFEQNGIADFQLAKFEIVVRDFTNPGTILAENKDATVSFP